MPSNILRLDSAEKLFSEVSKTRLLAPVHIFVVGEWTAVAEAVLRVRRDHMLSIMFSSAPEAAEALAEALNDVPVFVVTNFAEAKSVALDLELRPQSTVLRALNGTAVAVRYLEGSAT